MKNDAHFSGNTEQQPILLFDGVCNLCNTFVQFVLQRDPKGTIRFASLQSDFGQRLLKKYNFPTDSLDTVVLIENKTLYSHSDVGLRVVKHLNGLWPVLNIFRWIPRFLRDPIYNWIAANRYRWFGKQDQCLMPQPEWKDRFLDA
ncbi:MAG: thiol-disulfide oxidoreductase DCC family protein [Bacteroidota bacterium]